MSDSDGMSWEGAGHRSRPPGPHRQKQQSRVIPVVVVGCIAAALLALHLRKPHPGEALDAVPAELLGRWVTKDPRYADRALQIQPGLVILHVGPGVKPRRGKIESRRTWMEGATRVVRITYDAGEGPETLDLLLVSPDTIRLRNPREVVWTKAH